MGDLLLLGLLDGDDSLLHALVRGFAAQHVKLAFPPRRLFGGRRAVQGHGNFKLVDVVERAADLGHGGILEREADEVALV